jgi:polar amino acid transport system substrate-binding protein
VISQTSTSVAGVRSKEELGVNQNRQLMIVLVVAIIVGGLAGFGASKLGGGSSGGATTTSFLQKWQSAGIKVGCADSPPTIVVGSDGSCSGPDLLPLQELADTMKVKLTTVATSWQNIVTGVEANQYDFAADLDATTQRALAIRYTDPVWSYPAVFVVPGNTKYRNSTDLLASKMPIATASGNAQDLALRDLKANELLLPDYAQSLLALTGGKAVAVFADNGTAEVMVQQQPSLKIIIPNPAIFVHDVSYGVLASIDQHSLQAVNITIKNQVLAGKISRAFAAAGYLDIDQLMLTDMVIK